MINNKPAGKKIVVSFSGGLTSAYMLIKICIVRISWKPISG